MNTIKTLVIGFLAVGVITLRAQQVAAATSFYGPGDTIRLSITLDGHGLDDISKVQAHLGILQDPSLNQKGFATAVHGGESRRISKNTFVVELKVPEMIAANEYRLDYVWIEFKESRPSAYYNFGTHEIPDLCFQIRNEKHFDNPRVKNILELREPVE